MLPWLPIMSVSQYCKRLSKVGLGLGAYTCRENLVYTNRRPSPEHSRLDFVHLVALFFLFHGPYVWRWNNRAGNPKDCLLNPRKSFPLDNNIVLYLSSDSSKMCLVSSNNRQFTPTPHARSHQKRDFCHVSGYVPWSRGVSPFSFASDCWHSILSSTYCPHYSRNGMEGGW